METDNFRTLVRDKIQEITRFNTSQFDKRQLEITYRMNQKKGRISAGSCFSLILGAQNKFYGFGANGRGQLGLGNHEPKKIPTLMRNNPTIINRTIITKVSGGNSHSLMLDSQGRVYSFGGFDFGCLGFGTHGDVSTPILIPYTSLEQRGFITEVAAAEYHSLILNSQGQVFSFGFNGFGQLGLQNTAYKSTPTLIPFFDDSSISIMGISTKGDSSLLLSTEGRVYGIGNNALSQLGIKDVGDIRVPTLIENLHHIIDLATGGGHSLFLDSQGEVYSCGCNLGGQLGLGGANNKSIPTLIELISEDDHLSHQKTHPFITIAVGLTHSLILDSRGQVFSFGSNSSGELGLGVTKRRLIPTLIKNFPNIIAISAGSSFSLICDSQGQVFGFGLNLYGQIGLGDCVYRSLPTLIEGFVV
jgi:alpha-tubulin suppressor-like RCC1 family protein